MFERFTQPARQVVVLAQNEARALRHNYIGTEHLLLGLLREEEGLAARVLEQLDITIEEVRAQVERIVGRGDEVAAGQIPFTPAAKKTLELGLREAMRLGHNYIGTEHILLGLVAADDQAALRILREFDADPEKIRNEILRMLSGPGREARRRSEYGPPVSPLPRELAAATEKVRSEKEEAIEAQDFERAARLRTEERKLTARARGLAEGDESPESNAVAFSTEVPREVFVLPRWPLVAALVVAAVGFPLGLLVGWAIWG